MIICITKNGEMIARTESEGVTSDFALQTFENAPEYPTEPAGVGYYWDLRIVDGKLEWVKIERELTIEERMEKVEEKQNAWKVGETVNVGDRRYYNGNWYECIQAHTTQADWTPDVAPALWKVEE